MASEAPGGQDLPSWVEAVVELVEEGDLPDPWAATPVERVDLTPEQRSFLSSLAEQPDVPRLRGLGDLPEATVDGPGDPPGAVEPGRTGDSPDDPGAAAP